VVAFDVRLLKFSLITAKGRGTAALWFIFGQSIRAYFLVQPYISILNLFSQDCNLTTCFLDSAGNANPLNYYSFPYQLERLHSELDFNRGVALLHWIEA
ncbi:unnamed protein product, partial [Brassica rapa subsp. trilocularis]